MTTGLLAAGAALFPASAAVGGCARTYEDSLSVQSSGGAYWYGTPTHHIVDCNAVHIEVNKVNGSATCAQFRVRVFPSSGGSNAKAWHTVCEGQTAKLIGNHLVDTEYRVESSQASNVQVWD